MSLEALTQRRTIRNFDPEYIPTKEQLDIITAAGNDAPTSNNCQEIDLIVIKNKEKIKQISKASYEGLTKNQQAIFDVRRGKYAVKDIITCDAPIMILLVKNDRTHPIYNGINAGTVLMSMMVAAQSVGLNSMTLGCVMNPKVEDIVGIPHGSLVIGLSIGKGHKKPILDHKEKKSKTIYIE